MLNQWTPKVFSLCQNCLCWSTAKLRRKQLLSLFFIFIAVTAISSLIYNNSKLHRPLTLKGILKQVFPSMLRFSPKGLPYCNFFHNDTKKGPIEPNLDALVGIAELEQEFGPLLKPGGHYEPSSCRSKQKVALIVPYRDRRFHLKQFLRHMHPFLQRQHFEYRIFVIEQEGIDPFNRAILMNIGFVESLKLHSFSCFVFHDIDLLPLDDRIYYSCTDQNEPVHLSRSIDSHKNKLMYTTLFGGASVMSREIMEKVNGFSNVYFGWGGEDDDMSYRLRSHGMYIVRYSHDIARYTMLGHRKADAVDREKLLSSGRGRIHKDGLNSLKYELADIRLLPLYTWILVKINKTAIFEEQGLLEDTT